MRKSVTDVSDCYTEDVVFMEDEVSKEFFFSLYWRCINGIWGFKKTVLVFYRPYSKCYIHGKRGFERKLSFLWITPISCLSPRVLFLGKFLKESWHSINLLTPLCSFIEINYSAQKFLIYGIEFGLILPLYKHGCSFPQWKQLLS
jgi:hypothetical protein